MYVINGGFLAERIHGITRYAYEMTLAIDSVVDAGSIILVCPKGCEQNISLTNIPVFSVGNGKGIYWEQTQYAKYLRKHKDCISINFCNTSPLFVTPGITAIHDVSCKVNPEFFSSVRNKMSKVWHCFQYWYICRHERKIITVSNFSKGEIERTYKSSYGKLKVIYPAWQHTKKVTCNDSVFDKYSFLSANGYYFSLSTLGKNKNGKWIIEIAKSNPHRIFVIAGKIYEIDFEKEIPANVFLLGYISDEDAYALIKNAIAFLFPSIYEGFGLPPLEALSLGTKVVASNVASIPEVLEDCAYYINPYQYDTNIDDIFKTVVASPEYLLKKYDWKKSAKELLEMLYEER